MALIYPQIHIIHIIPWMRSN